MPRPIKFEETQHIRDIATIMATNPGPFTRAMIWEKMSEIYPDLSKQELKIIVSSAFEIDKRAKKRFKLVAPGWWDLEIKHPG